MQKPKEAKSRREMHGLIMIDTVIVPMPVMWLGQRV
jgi:hypothetical protein